MRSSSSASYLWRTVATFATALAAAATVAVLPATVQAAEPKLAYRPIVFVHGYNAGPGVWSGMIGAAEKYGYHSDELFAFSYAGQTPGNTSIRALGDELGAYIRTNHLTERSPDGSVDIIAHSMGGLVARSYLKGSQTARNTTAHLVTLGTPNHGTVLADLCGNLCDGQTREMRAGGDFLENLNSGDETPGPTRFTTFRSNIGDEPLVSARGTDLCDGVVFGGTTSALRGANNLVTPCLAHGELYNDAWTRQRALQSVADLDGVSTPFAVQISCGELDGHWGKDKWTMVYGESCVTATRPHGAVGARQVTGELQIRGCGYRYSFVGLWAYADAKTPCEVSAHGIVWDKGEWGVTNSRHQSGDRAFNITTDTITVSPDHPVAASWTFNAHAWNDAEYDVTGAKAHSGDIVIR